MLSLLYMAMGFGALAGSLILASLRGFDGRGLLLLGSCVVWGAALPGFMEGRLVTRPMTWPGGDLLLNASTTRELDAYPLDGGGEMRIEA